MSDHKIDVHLQIAPSYGLQLYHNHRNQLEKFDMTVPSSGSLLNKVWTMKRLCCQEFGSTSYWTP